MQLYKELSDCPNITYLVLEIKKSGFKKLDYIISPCIAASKIPKTTIFVDNIDKAEQLKLYLQSWLFPRLQQKVRILIQIFLANLLVDTSLLFLENFCNRNIRI